MRYPHADLWFIYRKYVSSSNNSAKASVYLLYICNLKLICLEPGFLFKDIREQKYEFTTTNNETMKLFFSVWYSISFALVGSCYLWEMRIQIDSMLLDFG
jgi:hypothetical protein